MKRKVKLRKKTTGALKKSYSDLRQQLHPREFRIWSIIWPTELEDFLEVLAQSPKPEKTYHVPAPTPEDVAARKELRRLYSDMGTGLWRLRRKMLDPATGDPREEMRRAYRHFQFTWDALSRAEIEVQDYEGQAFDPGLSLKVIEYQPVSGMNREEVIETIKPAVYYKGELIQTGEVIVGTPPSESPDS
ncbi:MAG TPA: hypothetical protein VF666_16045 [Pyrinomonadaceae bacterium]|jgi:hypothetical protein